MHASDPMSVHQEPVKVTLFGKSILGIISDLKIILDYLGWGWGLNPVPSVLLRGGKGRETQRRPREDRGRD